MVDRILQHQGWVQTSQLYGKHPPETKDIILCDFRF